MTAAGRIAVIGAGTMGTGIAQVFAAAGFEVMLCARQQKSLDEARGRIAGNLSELRAVGLAADASTLDRVRLTSDLAEAAGSADFVSENVPEDLGLKQALFHDVDRLVPPGTILATGTSGLSITAIASATTRPERVVGLHWFNPPHLMVPVEVTRGGRTSDATMQATCELARLVGRKPVRVERDVPGFLSNRLQLALVREAIHLVEQGIASPADVDLAVQWGLAFQWACVGPFRVVDLAGLATFRAMATSLYPALSNADAPQMLLENKLARGEGGAPADRGFHAYAPGAHDALVRLRDLRLLALRRLLVADDTPDGA